MSRLCGAPESHKESLLACSICRKEAPPMESTFDILKKTNAAKFEWVEAIRDLQTAEARNQARSACEYMVFSQHTQSVETCRGYGRSGVPSWTGRRRTVYFHSSLPG
jgi:hypothetical protein